MLSTHLAVMDSRLLANSRSAHAACSSSAYVYADTRTAACADVSCLAVQLLEGGSVMAAGAGHAERGGLPAGVLRQAQGRPCHHGQPTGGAPPATPIVIP